MLFDWLGFILGFAVLFYLAKKELWVALALAGLVVGLFSLPIGRIATNLKDVATRPNVLLLAVAYGLIPLIGGVLNHAKRFSEMADNLPVGRRSFLWFTPAFIGLLPVPGGAMLSAPMVKEVGKDLSGAHGFSINIWFRHVLVLFYPLSSLLICASMANVDVLIAASFLLPGAALMFVLGQLFFIRSVPSKEKKLKQTDYRKWLFPSLIILAAPAIHLTIWKSFPELIKEIPLVIGIFSTFVFASFYSKMDKKSLTFVFKKTKPWKFFLMVIFMFFFLEEFKATAIPAFFAELEYSKVLLVVPASFLLAFLTGRIPVTVSLVLPIYFAKFGVQAMSPQVFAVFYFSVFMGYMISPLHPCVLVTLESFHTSFKAFFQRFAVPVGILLSLNLFLSFML
jgi:integral membrane protein (TIGR00529 family)